MRRIRSFVLAGAAGLMALAGQASADVIIDDFSAGAAGFPITRTGIGTTTLTQNGVGGVLGGQRVTALTATAATTADTINARVVPGAPGFLDYTSDNGADGFLRLTYNGGGTLNTDLTGGGATNKIVINFQNYDFPGSTPLPVTATISDGTTTFSVTKNYSQLSPPAGTLTFALADFIGVNLTTVKSVSFLFDPIQASDFRLNFIAAVPEPSPIILGAVALAGAFGARKLRRKSS